MPATSAKVRTSVGVASNAKANSHSHHHHASKTKDEKKAGKDKHKKPVKVDMLSLFIQKKTDFAIETEALLSSGRVLISSEIRAALDAKKTGKNGNGPQIAVTTSIINHPTPSSSSSSSSSLSSDDSSQTSSSETLATTKGASTNHKVPTDFLQFKQDRGPWLPDWCKQLYTHPHPAVRLHQECLDFLRWASPTSREIEARNFTIADITNVIQTVIPNARIEIFGSTRSGLVLPASDVDLMVIMGPNVSQSNLLDFIRRAMEAHGSSRRGEGYVIRNARVPVYKFRHLMTSIDVDISINTADSFQQSQHVGELAHSYPAARPLTILIKYFLKQRNLNDLSIGGLGSHAILLMVLSFLQQRNKTSEYAKSVGWWDVLPQPASKIGLGGLLVQFFDYYGSRFDFNSLGIRLAGQGCLYRRTGECGSHNSCVIEDPYTNRNVAGGSYRINQIATAFRQAFSGLTAPLSAFPFANKRLQSGETHAAHRFLWGRPTLLARIFHVDEELRHHREVVESAYDFLPKSPVLPNNLRPYPGWNELDFGVTIDENSFPSEPPSNGVNSGDSDEQPSDELLEEGNESTSSSGSSSLELSDDEEELRRLAKAMDGDENFDEMESHSSGLSDSTNHNSIDTEELIEQLDEVIAKEDAKEKVKKQAKRKRLDEQPLQEMAPKTKKRKAMKKKGPKSTTFVSSPIDYDNPSQQVPVLGGLAVDVQRGENGSNEMPVTTQPKKKKKQKMKNFLRERVPNVYEGFEEKGKELFQCQNCGKVLKTWGFCVFCATKKHSTHSITQ